MTSSAFSIGLVVPSTAFEISDPQKLLKTFEDANALNGVGYRIAFCSKCGCYLLHEPVSPTAKVTRMMDFGINVDHPHRKYATINRNVRSWM
jgi:hypothetical protein